LVPVSAAFNYGVKEGAVKAFIESLTPFVPSSEEVEAVVTSSSESLDVHYADLVAYEGSAHAEEYEVGAPDVRGCESKVLFL